MKETIKPKAKTPNWLEEKLCELLRKSYPVAAAIVGIASKKENSTMASRLMPIASPATMVAPLRETPGIIASACAKPVVKDFL